MSISPLAIRPSTAVYVVHGTVPRHTNYLHMRQRRISFLDRRFHLRSACSHEVGTLDSSAACSQLTSRPIGLEGSIPPADGYGHTHNTNSSGTNLVFGVTRVCRHPDHSGRPDRYRVCLGSTVRSTSERPRGRHWCMRYLKLHVRIPRILTRPKKTPRRTFPNQIAWRRLTARGVDISLNMETIAVHKIRGSWRGRNAVQGGEWTPQKLASLNLNIHRGRGRGFKPMPALSEPFTTVRRYMCITRLKADKWTSAETTVARWDFTMKGMKPFPCSCTYCSL